MSLDMDTQSWTGANDVEISEAEAGQDETLQDPLTDPLTGGSDAVQMSDFSQGPASSRSARQVSSNDIENPRHVVDRAESDKTGFR